MTIASASVRCSVGMPSESCSQSVARRASTSGSNAPDHAGMSTTAIGEVPRTAARASTAPLLRMNKATDETREQREPETTRERITRVADQGARIDCGQSDKRARPVRRARATAMDANACDCGNDERPADDDREPARAFTDDPQREPRQLEDDQRERGDDARRDPWGGEGAKECVGFGAHE